MKEDLELELYNRYPKIFADKDKSMTETCMCWGFECGDGWYNIINLLCGNIQNHIDWQSKQNVHIPQVVAVQVKEKFGGLRFYYNGGDDIIDGMVRMAESLSEHTCEVCGAPGTQTEGGWIKTLCSTHMKKND